VDEKYERYKKDPTCITWLGKKDPLWTLVDWEKGKLRMLNNPKYRELIIGGCNIGAASLCILHDGSVLPCRRIPKPVGKVLEQKLGEIFIRSTVLNRMRNIYSIEKCNNCELLLYCRGCRAVAYGYEKNYFAPDPQCWK
jgi:radical SAM protein with 4Fe4S-binding SPASM domain